MLRIILVCALVFACVPRAYGEQIFVISRTGSMSLFHFVRNNGLVTPTPELVGIARFSHEQKLHYCDHVTIDAYPEQLLYMKLEALCSINILGQKWSGKINATLWAKSGETDDNEWTPLNTTSGYPLSKASVVVMLRVTLNEILTLNEIRN